MCSSRMNPGIQMTLWYFFLELLSFHYLLRTLRFHVAPLYSSTLAGKPEFYLSCPATQFLQLFPNLIPDLNLCQLFREFPLLSPIFIRKPEREKNSSGSCYLLGPQLLQRGKYLFLGVLGTLGSCFIRHYYSSWSLNRRNSSRDLFICTDIYIQLVLGLP